MLAGVTRAALIDLFDTLVWSEWPKLRQKLADAIGVETRDLSRAYQVTYSARQTGGYGSAEGDMSAILEACGVAPRPALVDELVRITSSHLDGNVHVYEDSLPTLRALRARGVRTAIVSNCDHFARPLVDELRFADEVDAVLLSVEVGAEKPKPAIYLAALEAVGAQPEQAVFVDDQPAYLDGAAALGIRTFHIVRAEEPFEGFGEVGAHEVIAGLSALL
jgi:putative hydrolase of the HAD superfamily